MFYLAPPTISHRKQTTILAPSACVRSRWSRWINRNTPDGPGDMEAMSVPELGIFCAGGRVSKIECTTTDGTLASNAGQIVSCTINNGFECLNNNNYPNTCKDYQVRYYCDCEGMSNVNEMIKDKKKTFAKKTNS